MTNENPRHKDSKHFQKADGNAQKRRKGLKMLKQRMTQVLLVVAGVVVEKQPRPRHEDPDPQLVEF